MGGTVTVIQFPVIPTKFGSHCVFQKRHRCRLQVKTELGNSLKKGVFMASAAPDLIVRGEAVERVYGNFNERRYVVNRRYQRKLIWTIEEKQNFIDSIIKGFPVPLILLAESATREGNDGNY